MTATLDPLCFAATVAGLCWLSWNMMELAAEVIRWRLRDK